MIEDRLASLTFIVDFDLFNGDLIYWYASGIGFFTFPDRASIEGFTLVLL
jgi:hypothetical protein